MLKSLSTLAVLFCLAGPALAEDVPPMGDGAWCRDNPDKCQEMKQRMQEKCAADPQRCEQMKARAAKWREQCQADPQACEEKKAKLRDRMEKRRAARQAAGQGATGGQ